MRPHNGNQSTIYPLTQPIISPTIPSLPEGHNDASPVVYLIVAKRGNTNGQFTNSYFYFYAGMSIEKAKATTKATTV
jgi:hypothetical protein